MYFTTSIAIAAGICLAYAVLHVSLGFQGVRSRTRNLLFGLFAATYAGSILLARTAYLAGTPADFFSFIRASWFLGLIGSSLLIWYVGFYTGVRPRSFLWIVTGAFGAIAFAAVFWPDLLFDTSSDLAVQTLPWGETVNVLSIGDTPLAPLILLSTVAAVLYMVFANVILLRRGDRTAGLALAIGIGWFVGTLVVENLVTYGLIDFAVLNDFGFLGFLLAMSLQEAKRRTDTERSLRAYQRDLQEMVADRTYELESAQAELLRQARDRAVNQERSRIAHELHDAVTQLLFSINLIAGSLPALVRRDPETAERTVGELQRLTRGALAEMRTLLRELRPHTIGNTELPTLVEQLTDGLAARHDIPVDLRMDLTAALPPAVHLTVYRIAQEALNNVAKHADASRLQVELTGDDRRVHLSVADDGYGFDAADVAGHNMGLEIMRERADGIGAELAVISTPNAGTTVDLSWSAGSHV